MSNLTPIPPLPQKKGQVYFALLFLPIPLVHFWWSWPALPSPYFSLVTTTDSSISWLIPSFSLYISLMECCSLFLSLISSIRVL